MGEEKSRLNLIVPLELKLKVKEKLKSSNYLTVSDLIRDKLREFVESG